MGASYKLAATGWSPSPCQKGTPMSQRKHPITRRQFLQTSAASAAVFSIVPRHVLGGKGYTAPSDTFGGALIGCGGQGNGTFGQLSRGLSVRRLAECDVKFL